jgi:hypothetical protein
MIGFRSRRSKAISGLLNCAIQADGTVTVKLQLGI